MTEYQHGDRIGEYTIEGPLGRGGMGAVYEAHDDEGNKVAVKLLFHPEGKTLQRFLREARIGKELRHPNLVETLELGEHEGVPYLVLGFVEGDTLASVLATQGYILPKQLVKLAQQLAAGLTVLHERGLVHRDLKPANVMLDTHGVVKIMDLGMLRSPDLTVLTQTGSVVGTPIYMAPEQLRGEQATPLSDLFSVAALLQTALSGHHPFFRSGDPDFLATFRRMTDGERRPWKMERADGPLDSFFARALATDPEERFPDAAELSRAFTRAVSEEFRPSPTAPGKAAADPTMSLSMVPVSRSLLGGTERTSLARRTGLALRLAASAAAVAVALLLIRAWMPSPASGPVSVLEREGLSLPEGRLLILRTEEAASLRLRGGAPAVRSQDGLTHFLKLPPAAVDIEVEGPSGELIFDLQVEELDWQEPVLRTERYTREGVLVLELDRPALVQVSLRHGDAWVGAARSDPARLRFLVPLHPTERSRRLELLLSHPGEPLLWMQLPSYGPMDEERQELLTQLRDLAPAARLAAAGSGPDAGQRLETALEAEGILRRVRLLRNRLELAPALLLEASEALSSLVLLESALLLAGRPPPFDPEDRLLHGVLHEERPRAQEPLPDPFEARNEASAAIRFRNARDFFTLDTETSRRHEGKGTGFGLLDHRVLEPQRFQIEKPASGSYWLDLHCFQWRGHYFARVRLNSRGPWYLCPDPRPWIQTPGRQPSLGYIPPEEADFLSLRIRIPPGVVREQNLLELSFLPYPSVAEEIRPYLLLHGLELYPAE